MQKVSPPRPVRSRLAQSLQCLAGVAGAAASFGLSAAGAYPAVSQAGLVTNGRSVEVTPVDRRSAYDERLSLKRALVDSGQPSGSEERKQLSSEERRSLMQDLRDAARNLNDSSRRSGN